MQSAAPGILSIACARAGRQFLLVHSAGSPSGRKGDALAIPKAICEEGERRSRRAREFGGDRLVPTGEIEPLGEFRQPGGKVISAFALRGFRPRQLEKSNVFAMDGPPHSGRIAEFPEPIVRLVRAGGGAAQGDRGQVPILDALPGPSADSAPELRTGSML